MTGHHPWKTLLERLSPERREAIAAGAAKIRAEIEVGKQGPSHVTENRRRRGRPLHDDARTTSEDRRQRRTTTSTR